MDYNILRGSSTMHGSGGRRTQKTEKSEPKNAWLSSFPNFFNSNKSNVRPTLDEHQNDRNEFFENHMMARYPESGVKRDEDLYFAQQSMMDEPKIPCEFCDKLFPASEVVLHTTVCNLEEVSLRKPISSERPKKNKTGSRQLKQFYDSTITSGPFFPAGRGRSIPSTKYDSIHKRLEQSIHGQYLNYDSGETSKPQMLHSDFQSISRKNQSSSALMSVRNNDSSDAEMEEADTKPSSETISQNVQENMKGQSRKFSHESGTCSNDSDEEISSMMHFIEANLNDDERGFDHKGAKPKQPKISEQENVVKPKVAKCSYCQTTLNDNILLFHEKECVYQPTKCPDCSATMPLKDADSHFCKPAKENNKVSEIDLLSKNFKDLFTDENCWDTVLQVGSKEFKAHRTILIARSSVFSAMFQHDTSEKQTGLIKVPDCDPDTFKEFLEYLYCGKLENISSKCALHLYTISDKYNVQELKSFCAKYLMQNITTENICEVAILADMYDETELFSAVQDFFNKNFKEIVMISVWEDLFKKNFRLANKLLIGKAKVEQ